MALLSGLAGMLGRFAGRLLNSSLGWATILLFGKVSGRKQGLLLAIALGALAWVVLLVGVVLPDVGTALIAVVPAPAFVSRDLLRLVMLAGAIVVPPLMGTAAIFVMDKGQRPHGTGVILAILRGYPFALLLAAIILTLAVVATVRKVQSLSRRWEDAHIAVIVKPGAYDEVLGELERVLRAGGLDVRRDPAPRILSGPPRLLGKVAGSALGSLVPDRLMTLKADGLEALIYPSDISIGGTRDQLARARALIATQLTHASAYLTTTPESEHVEDAIRAMAEAGRVAPAATLDARLPALDRQVMRLTVPYDEWETVYRERLQVERDLLRASPPTRPVDRSEPRATPPGMALAVGATLATVVDVLLILGTRRSRQERRSRSALGHGSDDIGTPIARRAR